MGDYMQRHEARQGRGAVRAVLTRSCWKTDRGETFESVSYLGGPAEVILAWTDVKGVR